MGVYDAVISKPHCQLTTDVTLPQYSGLFSDASLKGVESGMKLLYHCQSVWI